MIYQLLNILSSEIKTDDKEILAAFENKIKNLIEIVFKNKISNAFHVEDKGNDLLLQFIKKPTKTIKDELLNEKQKEFQQKIEVIKNNFRSSKAGILKGIEKLKYSLSQSLDSFITDFKNAIEDNNQNAEYQIAETSAFDLLFQEYAYLFSNIRFINKYDYCLLSLNFPTQYAVRVR